MARKEYPIRTAFPPFGTESLPAEPTDGRSRRAWWRQVTQSTARYRVVTDVSSLQDGRPLLHVTNNLNEARRECREWAEYDDHFVWVLDQEDQVVYSVNGFEDASRKIAQARCSRM